METVCPSGPARQRISSHVWSLNLVVAPMMNGDACPIVTRFLPLNCGRGATSQSSWSLERYVPEFHVPWAVMATLPVAKSAAGLWSFGGRDTLYLTRRSDSHCSAS